MTVFRVCWHCEEHFEQKRPHARYCSDECRYEAWVKRQKNSRETPAQRVEPQTRRKSRDGKGAKVYLTPEEIDFLDNTRKTFRSSADWEAHLGLGRKLSRAKRRLR